MAKKNPKRILIGRPDRIGDVVLSTALAREIKKEYPDSFVAVLVRNYTKDIFLNNPHVDLILPADEYLNSSKLTFIKQSFAFRKFNFSHALMLLPNERINYLLFLAGIKNRIGVGHKFYQFITGVKGVSRNKYVPLRHEADYCMDLARRIGVHSTDFTPEIYLTDKEKEQASKTRLELINDKKYLVGVHITSGNSAPNWEEANYLELVKSFGEEESIQVVVTDNKIPAGIEKLENVSFPNINNSLRESIINLSSLDLLISASTGPMHICAALNVKTTSLFCPLTACSPKLWGPLGNTSEIILPSEGYCQNKCPGDPKKCTFASDGGISVKEVMERSLKLIS